MRTGAFAGSALFPLIVSSIIQEGPAYPRFPEAIYYFIGGLDEAIMHLKLDELPISTEVVIKKGRYNIIM